jgi:hypothetical protein
MIKNPNPSFLQQYAEHLFYRFDYSPSISEKEITTFWETKNQVTKKDDIIINLTRLFINKFKPMNMIANIPVNIEDADGIYNNFKSYRDTKVEKWNIDRENEFCMDTSIDTNGTFYLKSLSYTTAQLKNAFGKPIENELCEKNRYEWKFRNSVNGIVYSIYDWLDENRQHEAEELVVWHVASLSCEEYELQCFLQFLEEVINSCSCCRG